MDERSFNKRIDGRFGRWVVVTATQSPSGEREIRLLDIYAIPGVLYTTVASTPGESNGIHADNEAMFVAARVSWRVTYPPGPSDEPGAN